MSVDQPQFQSGPVDDAVAAVDWYHTLQLPGGIVTPGEYDLRGVPGRIGFPTSLSGRRCLDVGTRDGFWAFEMERRGAAKVIAIDLSDHSRLDWPGGAPPHLDDDTLATLDSRGRAFETAHRAPGSSVEWLDLSIYDLTPEAVGDFDFVFLGTLLLHLRDPIGGLMAVRRVLRPTGELLVNDVVSLAFSPRRRPMAALMTSREPFWWHSNLAALRRMVEAAGFTVTGTGGPYFERNGASRRVARPRGGLALRRRLQYRVLRHLGAPHAWVSARRA